jgi:prepilin-type N-terminal cleavage/methylation domain-containing protein/prepilin-type processing-associated H-X9-DG protein
MHRPSRPAFSLIELLIVIAVIAIIAAILFPVFAQARERARMSACMANMRQIGHAMMMYVQDYDETYPYVHFHSFIPFPLDSDKGNRTYCWRNALLPYLKSIDILACPSNPSSHGMPGTPASEPARPGANAEGWEVEPGQRMPISYAMNACATNWWPADSAYASPPLRQPQVVRPTETILIAETRWPNAGAHVMLLWEECPAVFAHRAGQAGNFVFYDGHVKSKKWLRTLYPLYENNWELSPNPDFGNRNINGAYDCQLTVPASPAASEFQTKECLAYQ